MPVITVRNLCSIGGFGNQLFLFCFAKAYSRAMGCELQVPFDWIGRKIFVNATEPPISHPHLAQTDLDARGRFPIGYFGGRVDMDLFVYAQSQWYVDFYTRADVRDWLTIKPEFDSHPSNPTGEYSAAHIRRGDYVDKYANRYCTVSDASYDKAIADFHIPEPVYQVQEGWRPEPPKWKAQGVGWLADFILLRDAAHLLRANSSFSVFAAWLGHGKVYSPVVKNLVGWNDVDFIEASWPNTAGSFANQSDLHIRE